MGFGYKIKTLLNRIPNADKAIFSVHCHNDLGLAVANSLAAVANGARQVECTINGLGERAGNAALEEIVKQFSPCQGKSKSEHLTTLQLCGMEKGANHTKETKLSR